MNEYNQWMIAQSMQQTIREIRDILRAGFAEEIREENDRREKWKEAQEKERNAHEEKSKPFIKQFTDYVDEMISEGEWAESDRHKAARAYGCLTRAGIYSFEEYDKWSVGDLMKIRNFGKHTLETITIVRGWHEGKKWRATNDY